MMTPLRNLIHEIHRRSLWQVLGIYALASWIIYQVVLALWEGIGLPSWVPGTALTLLLIGLPIVLATAFVQEGAPGLQGDRRRSSVEGLETTADTVSPARSAADTATARGVETDADPAPGDQRAPSSPVGHGQAHRLFTWNRAVTGGVLAFALLGLATSGFMGMRALGIGPAATLISSGELEETTRVLVADFASPPGDSLTASALAEALRIDLAQSRSLRVVDPRETAPALERMERAPNIRLTEDVATELAIREGIPVVLVGELTPVGSGYQITARLVRPDSNRVLLRVRERAANEDDVLPAMDRLTAELLERTGESLRAVRSSRRLAAYTTSSLEALRIYSQAQRVAMLENDDRRAAELLEEAIREDSTFAMAWRKLGAVRSNVGDRTGSVEAFTRAYELSERLPESERLQATGDYYAYVDYRPDRVVDAYERLAELQPDNAPHNNLGVLYSDMGEFQRAAESGARAVAALDSSALPLGNLVLWSISAGDTAGARESLDARLRLYPENQSNATFERDLLYARGEIDAVRANIDSVLSHERRVLPVQAALFDRANLEARAGRLGDATRTLEEHDERLAHADLPTGGHLLNLFYLHRLVAGDSAQAARYLDRFAREVFQAIPELDRPYLPLTAAYAILGDVERAKATFERWQEVVPEEMRRRDEKGRQWAEGMLSLAEGREDEAFAMLRESTQRTGARFLHLAFLAWAYDTAGRADSAMATYHRYEQTPHFNRLFADGAFLGLTYERLGALHEEAGDRAEAARYYARFIDLWADADPELQPRVEAARRALERLTREGS